jgi:lysophospholipase L1-like esterase
MAENTKKVKSRKTAIALSVVFALLVLALLGIIFYPDINDYMLRQQNNRLYGGMTAELKDSTLYKDLKSGKSICFLGDSITSGYHTDEVPWYQPLTPHIKGEVYNFSRSGWTINNLIDNSEKIPAADIYIIAIGINDILFYDESYASHTSDEFAQNAGKLTSLIKDRSSEAKIYYVSPWTFCDLKQSYFDRGDEYRQALASYCKSSGCIYINADPVITSVLESEGFEKYMFNQFHPNAPYGIGLFSYAVLKAAHDQGI